MPYVRKSSYKRKYTKKPKSFASRVRKVITAAAQLKHAANSTSITSMDSDIVYYTSPTQTISQGTGIGQRIGDQVKLHMLKINGQIDAPTSVVATAKFRVAVFYSTEDKAASSVTATAFTQAEIFLPNASPAVSNHFDEKAVTVLADINFDLNSLTSTAPDVKSFAIYVPLKDVRARYQEGGSAFVDKKNLYIMVTGWSPIVANVTNIGNCNYAYDLQFKDI